MHSMHPPTQTQRQNTKTWALPAVITICSANLGLTCDVQQKVRKRASFRPFASRLSLFSVTRIQQHPSARLACCKQAEMDLLAWEGGENN